MNNQQNRSGMAEHPFEYAGGSDASTSSRTDGMNPGVEDPENAPSGMDSSHARKILERRASKVSEEDVEKLQTTLKEKIRGLKDLEDGLFWIGTLIGRAKLLWSMIRDGEFKVSTGTMLMVVAGLIYFVVPIDFTPDFIPGFGYVDDAVVLSTLWSMVQGELERYILFLRDSGREIDDLDALAFADGPPSEQGDVELSSFSSSSEQMNHNGTGREG